MAIMKSTLSILAISLPVRLLRHLLIATIFKCARAQAEYSLMYKPRRLPWPHFVAWLALFFCGWGQNCHGQTYNWSTLAGGQGNGSSGFINATGTNALFNGPQGLAVDSAGNVYVADSMNLAIRKITPGGVVSTLASGIGKFGSVYGVAVDANGIVYVTDPQTHLLDTVSPTGVVTNFANGGYCLGVSLDSFQNCYVLDEVDELVEEVTPAGVVSMLGTPNQFLSATFVAANRNQSGIVYVADTGDEVIRQVTSSGGITGVTPVAGVPHQSGTRDGSAATALFNQPEGVAVDANDNVYVADSGNHSIRFITFAGVVSTIGGQPGQRGNLDGLGAAARFNAPAGIALDSSGNLYVADYYNNRIVKGTPMAVPVITQQPSDLAIPPGSNVVLSVVATGSGPLTYQWFFNSAPLPSATSPTLSLNSIAPAQAGAYQVVISNSLASATSQVAMVTVMSFSNLYSFSGGSDGAYPQAPLVSGPGGDFYGTTYSGGSNGYGAIFKVSSAGFFTPLYSFTNGADGANPSGLVLAADGNFYGTTFQGGAHQVGAAFKMTPSGILTPLHSFGETAVAGADPSGLFAQGVDGNFYGVTSNGGTNGWGTVFKMTAAGAVTYIHSFGANVSPAGVPVDGGYPASGLILGSDGSFYGTTEYGGNAGGYFPSGNGTVFQVNSNGVFALLHSFSSDAAEPEPGLILPFYTNVDGAVPNQLMQANDGTMYGTTAWDGPDGFGTAYQISTNGSFGVLHAFAHLDQLGGILDGFIPQAGLLQGANGMLYGTTGGGADYGFGTIFQMTTNGTLTLLRVLSNADGTYPDAALVQGRDGRIYGVASSGGTSNMGTIFAILAWTGGASLIPPTAVNQSIAVPQDQSAAVTLTGNDATVPPLPLTYRVSLEPLNGTLSGSPPNLSYMPTNGFTGSDSFQFFVNNGVYDSLPATVTISVAATNQTLAASTPVPTGATATASIPPTATEAGVAVTLTHSSGTQPAMVSVQNYPGNPTPNPIGGPGTTFVDVRVLGAGTNDEGAIRLQLDDTITCALVGCPGNGVVVYQPPQQGPVPQPWIRPPNDHGHGPVVIPLPSIPGGSTGSGTTIPVGNGGICSCILFGTVFAIATVVPPIPATNEWKTIRDQTISVPISNIIAGASSSTAGPLSVTAVNSPSSGNGSVLLTNGVVTYSPALGFTGPDTFTYILSDDFANATGSVNIVVSPPMLPPATNLLVNGSFESPAISSNSYLTLVSPTGWLDGARLVNSGGTGWVEYYYLVPPAEEGQQYVDIDNDARLFNKTLSQTFTIGTPGDYKLSWYDNTYYENVPSRANYDVTITNADGNLVVSNYLSTGHYTSGASISNDWGWASQSEELNLRAGTYTLLFNGDDGSSGYDVLIDNISLLLAQPLLPPSISVQPTNFTASSGATATLAVTAAGAPPLNFHWQFNATNLTDSGRISGSTSNVLTINSTLPGDAGNYDVIVSNAYGAVTSSIVTLALSQNCTPSPTDLQAWWRGDGNAFDSVGTNNGAIYGGVTFVPGEVGQGFNFDGDNNSYDLVPYSDKSVPGTGSFTIECWINSSKSTGYIWIQYGLGSLGSGGADDVELFIGTDYTPTNTPSFAVRDHNGNWQIFYASNTITDGQYHHLVAGRDLANGLLFLYVDGVANIQPLTVTGSLFADGQTAPLMIGNAYWCCGQPIGAHQSAFSGIIDEISYYNRALTSNEIAAIYSAGSGGKCAPLTALNLVVNGSFEAPQVASNAYAYSVPSGWTWTPGVASTPEIANGIETASGVTYEPAEDGQQWLSIGQSGDGSLSQFVIIPISGNYLLSWYAIVGPEGQSSSPSPYAVSFGVSSNRFDAGISLGQTWEPQSLLLSNVPAGQYTLTFTPETTPGGFATIIDNVSLLFVQPILTPLIFQQPTNQGAELSSNVTFQIMATGNGLLTYQWQFHGTALADNGRIAGSSSNTLTIANLGFADAGSYEVIVGNTFGSVTSSIATLSVTIPNILVNGSFESPVLSANSAYPVSPTGWYNPNSYLIDVTGLGSYFPGAYVPPAQDGNQYADLQQDSRYYASPLLQTFSISTSGLYVLSWYDNTEYEGEPTTLNYDVTITNVVGTLVSSNFLSSDHYAAGTSISNNWAFGTQTIKLQAGTYTLAFNGDNPPGGYPVFIDDVSLVFVQPLRPSIIQQPTNITVGAGSNAAFAVEATGAPELTYRWQYNNTNLMDDARIFGSSSNLLTFIGVSPGEAGIYGVIITNAYGSITSAPVKLSITGVPVAFGTAPGSVQVLNGQFQVLLTGLTGQGPIVIQTSSNLVEWTPIFTNPPGFGSVPFVDVAASNSPSRFYRALTPFP